MSSHPKKSHLFCFWCQAIMGCGGTHLQTFGDLTIPSWCCATETKFGRPPQPPAARRSIRRLQPRRRLLRSFRCQGYLLVNPLDPGDFRRQIQATSGSHRGSASGHVLASDHANSVVLEGVLPVDTRMTVGIALGPARSSAASDERTVDGRDPTHAHQSRARRHHQPFAVARRSSNASLPHRGHVQSAVQALAPGGE